MYELKDNIKNVLVSGAAGDIGIALGRILQEENILNILGCDIFSDHAGECVFNTFIQIPRADHRDYFSSLKHIFTDYNIELFIPSSEAEIKAVIDYGLRDQCLFGVPVLIANEETVLIALDKLSTARYLKKNNIKAPWTISVLDGSPIALPCIFKPRSGQGSKGLEIVYSTARATELEGTIGYIWQELLLPNDQEYTCGVYRDLQGNCRSILMKRTLDGGFTGKGEVVENKNVTLYVETIATVLNVKGAVNFQLRLTSTGPVLFEINPRFSSTVMFRHKLGFTDLVWSIEERLGLPISNYLAPQSGIKFYRGSCEYIK
jgi:carbamoyl-phosphate synthase large subunit